MVGDEQVMAEHANTGDNGSLSSRATSTTISTAINELTFTSVQTRVHNRVKASYGHADQGHGEGGVCRYRGEPGSDYGIRVCGAAA